MTSVAQPPDRELIAGMVRRDAAALATLYDRYVAAASALANRILGDRAEGDDTLQSVFARLWREADKYDDARGSVATWVISAVRNAAIDRVRRRIAFQRAAPPAGELPPTFAEVPPMSDEHQRVMEAVDTLPADPREAIELAYFRGMTLTEIAARLGQPPGTVKARMRLGMATLRQALLGRPHESP